MNSLRQLFAPTPPASIRSMSMSSFPVERGNELSVRMSVGVLKRVAIWILSDCISLCHIAEAKANANHGVMFKSENQLPYAGRMDLDDVCSAFLSRASKVYPKRSDQYKNLEEIIVNIVEASTIHEVISAFGSLIARTRAIDDQHVLTSSDNIVENNYFQRTLTDTHVILAWDSSLGARFTDAVGNMLRKIRSEARLCSAHELLATYLAYHKMATENIQSASNAPDVARFLGTSGFRTDAQTYMSLTDPGDGHISGTTRKTPWLRGVIVHVEHLERPNHLPRSECESYRIPSLLDFARVRLHVGSAAPTTYFVGRMLKDGGNFDHDLIKVVNTVSAAASAAFALGAAECKVAMDGLTTAQMIKYMRALNGNTLRATNRQYFSCAWNLNSTIVDDTPPFSPAIPKMLSTQMAIGRRAIQIAALGGFEKITWDGASDTYPSKCIIEQLGFKNALELVHMAHEAGFVTYFSAGFKFHQIADAVLTGVDGIGIGGAQILRYMDHKTGMHGPYLEENINEILKRRDDAERSLRGQGVKLLCRLDRMYFEGSITATGNKRRIKLYEALAEQRGDDINNLLRKCSAKMDLPQDGETPFIGQARRLINSTSPLLKEYVDDRQQWIDFTHRIMKLVTWGNDMDLYEEYLSHPWATWRAAYRAAESKKSDTFYLAKTIPALA
ncbi:hypothetical protein DFJ77DRAFT_531000 [Powellomyces hirtus]|nr:hypothetical protein DFJ77DRAFT_531000 [Powellomyces hirtus]